MIGRYTGLRGSVIFIPTDTTGPHGEFVPLSRCAQSTDISLEYFLPISAVQRGFSTGIEDILGRPETAEATERRRVQDRDNGRKREGERKKNRSKEQGGR